MVQFKRPNKEFKRNLEVERRVDHELFKAEMTTLDVFDGTHHDLVNAQNDPEHGVVVS